MIPPQINCYSQSFFYGFLGGVGAYLLLFRMTRMPNNFNELKKKWPIIFFDLSLYAVGGGLVSSFLVYPSTAKAAFISGCAWEGIMGGYVLNKHKEVYKTIAEGKAIRSLLPEFESLCETLRKEDNSE